MSRGTRGDEVKLNRDLCGENRADVEAEQEGDRLNGETTVAVSEGEETDGTVPVTLREIMLDQQRLMTEQEMQRQMLVDLIKQQRAEIVRDREDMTETGTGKEMTKVSLPKPTKIWVVTMTLSTFWKCLSIGPSSESGQRMSELTGLLTGKAMASYANLIVESMNDYPTIRQGILWRY